MLFALADATYRFLHVDVNRNGRMHDSNVFIQSGLGIKLESGELNLPDPVPLPGTREPMPFVFLGDDAFSLKVNF